MARQMRYTVLPVGQGSGALVEVLENGVLQAPVLIDLGSRGWNRQAGQPSAAFVAQQLTQMAEPRLAAVFISHVDSDHINLLRRLLEKFKKRGQGPVNETLAIGNVWFGGQRSDYEKSRDKPLERLTEYGATVQTLGLKESDVEAGTVRFSYAGVDYSLLMSNVPDPQPEPKRSRTDTVAVSRKRKREADGFLRNVVSLVVVIKFGTPPKYIVAPGDAVGLTLAECNRVLSVRPGLANVLTLALPHHGSATSTYDMSGVRAAGNETRDQLAVRIVREFVNHLNAESITASAGENPTYKHPSSRVVADFARTVQKGWYQDVTSPNYHFFTAYYPLGALPLQGGMNRNTWPFSIGWHTGLTESNVFTIDYFRGNPQLLTPPEIVFDPTQGPNEYPQASYGAPHAPYRSVFGQYPPRAAGWRFPIAENGQGEAVERLLDLRFASAEERAALEAVHGPLPPQRFVFLPSAPAPVPPAEAVPPAVVREATVPPPSPPTGLRRARQLP